MEDGKKVVLVVEAVLECVVMILCSTQNSVSLILLSVRAASVWHLGNPLMALPEQCLSATPQE